MEQLSIVSVGNQNYRTGVYFHIKRTGSEKRFVTGFCQFPVLDIFRTVDTQQLDAPVTVR